MLAVAGAIPDLEISLLNGPAKLKSDGRMLEVGGRSVPVGRGSARRWWRRLWPPAPCWAWRACMSFLRETSAWARAAVSFTGISPSIFPNTISAPSLFIISSPMWTGRAGCCLPRKSMNPSPILVADAGFMYAAKMGGQAPNYDLFTPDAGELAFLADDEAPHPFYTRGFILHQGGDTAELIARAYRHGNAARHLLVKGSRDYLATGPDDIIELQGPSHPALEAIGGTGDTLTGLASIMAAAGFDLARAARLAAHANRLAGVAANPTPATRISEIINHLPMALERALARERA